MSETKRQIHKLRKAFLSRKAVEKQKQVQEKRAEEKQKLIEAGEPLFTPFEAQKRFFDAAFTNKYKRLILGGSIRSGKTYVCMTILLILARLFPNSRWLIIRQDYQKLRQSTFDVFTAICPPGFIEKIDGRNNDVYLTNGSRFFFRNEGKELDASNKFRGFYINGAFFDEINEVKEKTFNEVTARLGSYKRDCFIINAKGEKVYPPAWLLGSCNPCQNWVKTKWYIPWELNKKHPDKHPLPESDYFQPINIDENPHVSKEELEELKKIIIDESYYKAYIKGSWDVLDSDYQIIPFSAINQCHEWIESTDTETFLGLDVATTGKDLAVFTLLRGPNIYNIETHAYIENSVTLAQRVMELMEKYNIPAENICIDSIGNGVADFLANEGIYVETFKGNMAATMQPSKIMTFQNIRAQGFWLVKEKLKAKQIGGLENSYLKAELASLEKVVDGRTFAVESKIDYKRRTGKSPDYADSLMYAVWAKYGKEMLPSMQPFYLDPLR